jgi:hypothetical protein
MKKIVMIIILLAALGVLQAEVDGSRGFQVLRIIIDPVTAGQGGNGVLNSQSGYSFIDNAAAPLLQKGKVISFSQNMWLFDTSMSNIAYRNSKGRTSFGYAMRYLDYGKVENRDDTGIYYGEYHPMDLMITFNLGYRVLASHYLGINLSGIYEQIDDSSSTGISGDLGYVYNTPLKNTKLLGAVKNFGTTSQMDKEKMELPLTVELGLSRDFTYRSSRISCSVKIVKDIDNDEIKGNLGVEANVYSNFFVRSGYKTGSDLESYSGGFGVKIRGFMIDYAFCVISENLDDVHLVGISWHF